MPVVYLFGRFSVPEGWCTRSEESQLATEPGLEDGCPISLHCWPNRWGNGLLAQPKKSSFNLGPHTVATTVLGVGRKTNPRVAKEVFLQLLKRARKLCFTFTSASKQRGMPVSPVLFTTVFLPVQTPLCLKKEKDRERRRRKKSHSPCLTSQT